jgi:hypothetical protein
VNLSNTSNSDGLSARKWVFMSRQELIESYFCEKTQDKRVLGRYKAKFRVGSTDFGKVTAVKAKSTTVTGAAIEGLFFLFSGLFFPRFLFVFRFLFRFLFGCPRENIVPAIGVFF